MKKQATTLVEIEDSKKRRIGLYSDITNGETMSKGSKNSIYGYNLQRKLEAYSLLTIMDEDGDGRGKPVAYCFQRSETKDN